MDSTRDAIELAKRIHAGVRGELGRDRAEDSLTIVSFAHAIVELSRPNKIDQERVERADWNRASGDVECPHCTHVYSTCVAKAVLARTKEWRYIGAHHDRVTNGHNPREAKIHDAWKKLVGDLELSRILDEKTLPSARDWYVASSIVQWLATNVGMTVIEAAGYKYQQWEQDAADRELMRRRQDREQEAPAAPPWPTAHSKLKDGLR
jgi:hypothetical protein